MSFLKKSSVESIENSSIPRTRLVNKMIIRLFAIRTKQSKRVELNNGDMDRSLIESKMMILLKDDGGVYKGPIM